MHTTPLIIDNPRPVHDRLGHQLALPPPPLLRGNIQDRLGRGVAVAVVAGDTRDVSGRRTCSLCGDVNHLRRDCPIRRGVGVVGNGGVVDLRTRLNAQTSGGGVYRGNPGSGNQVGNHVRQREGSRREGGGLPPIRNNLPHDYDETPKVPITTQHTTKDYCCEDCNRIGHQISQCWTRHPELRPVDGEGFKKRKVMAAMERQSRGRGSDGDYFARNFPVMNRRDNQRERGNYAVRCSSSPADLERRLLATVTGDRAYFDEVFPVMSDNPLAKPRILATVQQFDARQAS